MCHVLIIEDDPIAALDIQAVLSSAGGTTFSFAASLLEAVDEARKTLPAVITSDVMLGNDCGPAAVRLIQAELGAMPVIFITGTPDQCVGWENCYVLDKPFHTDLLAATFRSVASGLSPEGRSTLGCRKRRPTPRLLERRVERT